MSPCAVRGDPFAGQGRSILKKEEHGTEATTDTGHVVPSPFVSYAIENDQQQRNAKTGVMSKQFPMTASDESPKLASVKLEINTTCNLGSTSERAIHGTIPTTMSNTQERESSFSKGKTCGAVRKFAENVKTHKLFWIKTSREKKINKKRGRVMIL